MCFLGEEAAKRTQGNITEVGKRITVSPVPRFQLILTSFLSAWVVALVNIALIMLYFVRGIKVINIHGQVGIVSLVLILGCTAGVAFGVFIESLGKWRQGAKSALLIGSAMLCAFLSGLMIRSMKDLVETHVPLLNRINPAALIADAFYCVAIYHDEGRLWRDLCLLGVISCVFLLAGWQKTRRMRYDSV